MRLLLLDVLQLGSVIIFNSIVDHKGTFIDADNLDGRGVDAEGAGNAVHESGRATIGEELVEGPLHANHGLNSVSRRNVKDAARSNVELEDVFDTNETVLAAELLSDSTVAGRRRAFIPLVHFNNVTVLQNLARLSAGVWNSDRGTGVPVVRLELESELLGRRASESQIVLGALPCVDDCWEALKAELACVETIPDVVHERVQLAVHVGALQLKVDRVQTSVPVVGVFTLEDKLTELGLLTNVQVV